VLEREKPAKQRGVSRSWKASLHLWLYRDGFAHLSLLWGRNQLKATYLMAVETAQGLLNEIGSEALLSGTHTAPSVVAQKIDSVTSADVVNVCPPPTCSLMWEFLTVPHCSFVHL